jgi:pyruvate dehydrogenase E2 component (dihydrolipoamide acetyltransferase)
MYGVRNFAAILNPPQATILAVGAAERRVVVRDGAPAVATVMTVTLSADHRAVDGATAAQLLSKFKALIEEPMAMLV